MHLRRAANWERGLSADALEALVGAMHLDRGFEAARQFVEWVLDDAASVGALHIDGNYKACTGSDHHTAYNPNPAINSHMLIHVAGVRPGMQHHQ